MIGGDVNKPPAFQFYPADFISDENVVLMNNQEVGCYIKLLCFCWKQGSIPNDMRKIAKLCNENETVMAQLWDSLKSCFNKNNNGRLCNPRLEKERKKQITFRKERSESGQKGAINRWNKNKIKDKKPNSSAIAKPLAEPMANDGSSSSSSSSHSISKKKQIYTQSFLSFWNKYPKKSGKKDAFKAYQKAKDKPPISELLKIIDRHIQSDQWQKEDGEFIPFPATWLNKGRWDDELNTKTNKPHNWRENL